jgi:hypothetical protein
MSSLVEGHRCQIEAPSNRTIVQIFEYERQFRSETILLRDEMFRRLPEEMQKDRRTSIFHYEFVNNSIAMGEVADDLERLALSLPIGTR